MGNMKHIHKDVVVTRNNDGELVVTSRQVAEDFGKRHSEVLRAIEDKIEINAILRSSKYFIDSASTLAQLPRVSQDAGLTIRPPL